MKQPDVGCKNGVIDQSFADVWRGIYDQQNELLAIDDADQRSNNALSVTFNGRARLWWISGCSHKRRVRQI